MMKRVRRSATGQAGVSLVEALVTLALASSVILVFALALTTVVRTDGLTNRQQRNNLALTSVTETLRRNDLSYYVCCPTDPTACDYAPAANLAGRYKDRVIDKLSSTGADVPNFEVTEIAYWSPGNFDSPTATVGGSFEVGDTNCSSTATALRFKVAVRVGSDVLRGEVVKRQPLPGEAQGAGS